jgi:hypothetical protein
LRQRLQRLENGLVEAFVSALRLRVNDDAAAERLAGRGTAQDQPVAAYGHERIA